MHRPMSDKKLASRINPTQSISSNTLDNTVREQIVGIHTLGKDAFVLLVSDANRATESSQNTVMLLVIHMMDGQTVVSAFQSSALNMGLEETVYNLGPIKSTVQRLIQLVLLR